MIAKTTRTFVRLKHPLKTNVEIHAVLPDTLEEFEAALARGELKELRADLVANVFGNDDSAGDREGSDRT